MDLKLATASQEILLGPFLDDDDGVTQKTGLTIANTDIKLFKTGGTALGNKNSGGATEIATGFYYATLDATDTDTLGPLVIVVQMTDCLCVRHEFNVVSAAYYDWVYGSTKPDVNTYSITANAITATAINADAITNAKIADDAIAVENIKDAAITASKIAGDAITADKIADNALANEHFAAGALTSTEITSAAGCAVASIANDAITANAIANAAIDANTFAANALDAVWSTAARTLTALDEDSTTLDLDATIEAILAASATIAALPTAAENADAVWDEAIGDHGGAGATGKAVADILADTNELQVDDTPTAVAAVKTVVDAVKVQTDKLTFTVANQVDANIQYINDTAVTGDGGATPWGPA